MTEPSAKILVLKSMERCAPFAMSIAVIELELPLRVIELPSTVKVAITVVGLSISLTTMLLTGLVKSRRPPWGAMTADQVASCRRSRLIELPLREVQIRLPFMIPRAVMV